MASTYPCTCIETEHKLIVVYLGICDSCYSASTTYRHPFTVLDQLTSWRFRSQFPLMESMDIEEEALDYSQGPYEGQTIFGSRSPNPSIVRSAPSHLEFSPIVMLPGSTASLLCIGSLSLEILGLDYPSLSPGTHNLLMLLCHPHLISICSPSITWCPPQRSPQLVSANPNSLPLGCFDSLVTNSKSTTPLKDARSDPLTEHPLAPRIGKRKVKCVKKSAKDLTITFGEDIPMGEVVDKANIVLVGHVRGRAYSATRLSNWVHEIWDGILQELPEVQSLARGWFDLHFSKAEYIDMILDEYWHIQMAPVLLKRWSPLFDPE